jgi:hypothetical protein
MATATKHISFIAIGSDGPHNSANTFGGYLLAEEETLPQIVER